MQSSHQIKKGLHTVARVNIMKHCNINNEIVVKHENGYYGKLYGKSSLTIYWGNKEVFHTGFREVNTASELYDLLSDIPYIFENL